MYFRLGHRAPQEHFLTVVQGAAGDVMGEPTQAFLVSGFYFYLPVDAETGILPVLHTPDQLRGYCISR